MTSDSFWSIGSVPDEYTVFNNYKSKADDNTLQLTNIGKEVEFVSKPSINFIINEK